jgi:hypothetical protein
MIYHVLDKTIEGRLLSLYYVIGCLFMSELLYNLLYLSEVLMMSLPRLIAGYNRSVL